MGVVVASEERRMSYSAIQQIHQYLPLVYGELPLLHAHVEPGMLLRKTNLLCCGVGNTPFFACHRHAHRPPLLSRRAHSYAQLCTYVMLCAFFYMAMCSIVIVYIYVVPL